MEEEEEEGCSDMPLLPGQGAPKDTSNILRHLPQARPGPPVLTAWLHNKVRENKRKITFPNMGKQFANKCKFFYFFQFCTFLKTRNKNFASFHSKCSCSRSLSLRQNSLVVFLWSLCQPGSVRKLGGKDWGSQVRVRSIMVGAYTLCWCPRVWYGWCGWYDNVWYGMVWYDNVWYGMVCNAHYACTQHVALPQDR